VIPRSIHYTIVLGVVYLMRCIVTFHQNHVPKFRGNAAKARRTKKNSVIGPKILGNVGHFIRRLGVRHTKFPQLFLISVDNHPPLSASRDEYHYLCW
jgi:hypothetical protein